MQICEPFTAWQSFVKRISWEGYGGYANIDSYNIRKILLSFFFPLFHVLKFFSNAVHYWWRDDHFSSLSRCREKSLQSVQLALLPTSLHHGCWLVLQFFHVHDVFPCRPRPRRQCISGASHSIMFPVRLLALLRMKLTSAIQLYRHDSRRRQDRSHSGQILFSFDTLRTSPSRLASSSFYSNWFQPAVKDYRIKKAISYDRNWDRNRNVYLCSFTRCILILI